ncbi:N-acetylglucosamine-6-phosphate deacetylase [Leucobacter ruminantium]|uniref:N-acetylglucosamine-6-phosphate deacetylase n=1 Tax=Leucobacter ruminantium TaxID=1289170 RepID=UPI003132F33A
MTADGAVRRESVARRESAGPTDGSGAEAPPGAVTEARDGTVTAARVVTGSAVHAPGWVSFEGGRITAVGSGAPETAPTRDLGEATLVPGFVDVHVHGGGGADYTEGSLDRARLAAAAHRGRGTTTGMASLVTDTPERLLAGVRMLAGLVGAGEVRGIHLEGPWLSPARAGAHDPSLLRAPGPSEIDALIEAGEGSLAMVTLAPELPGAIDAIARLTAAGVRVAVGHTDADYATARRAIDAGATIATHLFNAMRPLHHREPGPVLALLEDPRVAIELIADGTHLHPELARWAADRAGADRAMLVTDAMGAAVCGDGDYRLGALDVEVEGGVARLVGSETIAGSTATMDGLFRAWVRGAERHGDDAEDALLAAVRMTAANPARALGWSEVGDLAQGRLMDAAVLDGELRVVEVLRAPRLR